MMHTRKDNIMKILHLAEYASGGVATYLRNTIQYQLNSEDIDELILFNTKDKSEEFTFKSNKFKNIVYTYKRGITGVLRILKLRKIMDGYNPDVIHIHSTFAGLIRITYFLKKPEYKVVYCSHGWSFIQQNKTQVKKYIYSLIERILAIKTDLIVNISQNEQSLAKQYKLPVKKMKTIYNSIPDNRKELSSNNLESVVERKGNVRSLLFIGRFDKAKGLEFLINNLDFKSNSIVLSVIGESILNDSDSDLKKPNVNYLGWIDNGKLDSYIMQSDAVIIPSLWEGFGLVALEAMRKKKAVIASNAGGLPEIVEDGKNGLIFELGSKESLQKAIDRFNKLTFSELAVMGENGYQKYRNKYNFNLLNQKLLDEYMVLEEKNNG